MEDVSALEDLAIRLSAIPIAIFAAGGIAYISCAGIATTKTTYQKLRGDSRPFKELYNENWLIGTKVED